MSIFKKKEEEEEIEETANERKITRKLKDLNPENKRKRKEPPKPWGKKERLVILIVLLLTTLISALLLIKDLSGIRFERIELKKPSIDFSSINLFKGETIVIENK